MTDRDETDRRSRREVLRGGGAAAAALALAATPSVANTAREIDLSVDVAISELFASVPGARSLYNRASGVLVIANVIKAGFVFAGAYGEGALRIGDLSESYWSYTAGSVGFQAGAQRTRQALFFMTRPALDNFRFSNGFEVGADAEVTLIDQGVEASVDTTSESRPVLAIVYGREGLLGGASIQGGKYSRINA